MLGKKAVLMILTAMMMSVTYIFAIDQYDTMACEIKEISEKTAAEGIKYDEIGIELKGIKYNEKLSMDELEDREEEVTYALAHHTDCSKLCQMSHLNHASSRVHMEEDRISGLIQEEGRGWQYSFTIKNEKDIRYNTYYDLKITGDDISQLDCLRNWGIECFKKWKAEPQETIYFKGTIKGKLSEDNKEALKEQLFNQLEAVDTNSYTDDLNETTCAYYGYTKYIRSCIKEENGQKTNMQLSFKYNETKAVTEIIIAFPFYNEPF